jgi:flagellar protein FlaF
MPLRAYQRARSIAEQPRATEQRLFTEITGAMISARKSGRNGATLMPELHRNRELWGTIASACAATGNQLPDTLRAGIISLAIWVDRATSEVSGGQTEIDELIAVNLMIIDGLSDSGVAG